MPKYSGNNYELRIGRCKMEDKGEYICKAENSYGSKEEAAFLNVEREYLIFELKKILVLHTLDYIMQVNYCMCFNI